MGCIKPRQMLTPSSETVDAIVDTTKRFDCQLGHSIYRCLVCHVDPGR